MTFFFFFFQAEDGIRDYKVTGVQTCALPISRRRGPYTGRGAEHGWAVRRQDPRSHCESSAQPCTMACMSETHDAPKYTNRLIHETSPYLLQHAHNPVDWYPWGEEALARAKVEDK